MLLLFLVLIILTLQSRCLAPIYGQLSNNLILQKLEKEQTNGFNYLMQRYTLKVVETRTIAIKIIYHFLKRFFFFSGVRDLLVQFVNNFKVQKFKLTELLLMFSWFNYRNAFTKTHSSCQYFQNVLTVCSKPNRHKIIIC